jgi:hypothetical protein
MLGALMIFVGQVAAGAPADPPAAAPPPQQQEAADDADPARANANRRRCRTETITGSRMGARVCLSEAELAAQEREARQLLENSMRMPDNRSR